MTWLALVGFLLGPGTGAWALPQGAEVEHGSVSMDSAPDGTYQITASDQSIIRWASFDIGPSESVLFIQPSAAATVLNRVIGGSASQIAGRLTANGIVFLINPAGINIASSAVINVGGLVASSLELSNQSFLARQYQFLQPDGVTPGLVINHGMLTAEPGGVIALLGGAVANDGTITARLGTVALAAGSASTVSFDPDGRIAVAVDAPTASLVMAPDGRVMDAASNAGLLSASGGVIVVSASTLQQIFDHAVNQTGIIEATSVMEHGGRIFLTGAGGTVRQAGTLRADGGTSGHGGEVQIRATAGDAIMEPEAMIDLRGGAQGGDGGFGELSATGEALIGGTILGDVLPGYQRGSFVMDPPSDLTISSNTVVTTDTTYFANRHVKIHANVTANSRASLKFLADHNSATLQNWDDGSGDVTQQNGKVVTTNGGGSVTFAGANISLANNGVNSSGNLSFYRNNDWNVTQTSDLTNKIVAYTGTLTLASTGKLKTNNDLDSATLFNSTHHLRLESDSNLGGQAADLVDLNGKTIDTHNGNLTIVSRGTNAWTASTINAGTGTASVTTGGAMVDGNGAAVNITGSTVTLTAAAGIDLDTAVAGITATVTGAGALDLSNTGPATLTSVTTANGPITVSATGTLTLNTVSAAGLATLTSGASIVKGAGVTALTATGGATLTATGTIGLAATPLTVTVSGGPLSVSAAGANAGVSANVNGTVAPSGTLAVVGTPPGTVLFNGIQLYPVVVPPPPPPPPPQPPTPPAPSTTTVPSLPLASTTTVSAAGPAAATDFRTLQSALVEFFQSLTRSSRRL